MNDFFKDIIDDNTHIASSGEVSAAFSGYIDTGCYALNALLSGSIYGGVPNNKVTAFAGESATGKCARGTQLIKVYMTQETFEKLRDKF